jgi:hypothetical protein
VTQPAAAQHVDIYSLILAQKRGSSARYADFADHNTQELDLYFRRVAVPGRRPVQVIELFWIIPSRLELAKCASESRRTAGISSGPRRHNLTDPQDINGRA